MPDGEHNTNWWPQWRDDFEDFVSEHAREANPALISWKATANGNRRSHWLLIEEFDAGQNSPIPLYEVGVDPANGSNVIASVDGGRVDVVREGNNIHEVKFRGTLSPSLETLLDWAARDNDRKMLYAAELLISP